MNNNTKNKESAVFDFIRFPLISLVVYIHVLPSPVIVSFDASWENAYNWISSLISHNIGAIAVPCFFIISGYFYFAKMSIWNKDFYIKQQKNRLKTLILPYFIFNTLNILIVFVKGFIFNKIGGNNYGLDEIAVIKENSIFDLYIGMPINYPLWYLRDLITMSFCSFIFYYIFRYLNVFGLIILFVLYYSQYNLSVPGFSSTSILFFGIGSYFGIYKKSIINLSDKILTFSIPISSILVLISTYLDGGDNSCYYDIIIKLFIPFGVLSAFGIANKLYTMYPTLGKRFCVLGKYVFLIYSIHTIYIINWVKGILHRTPLVNYGWGMIIIYFLLPVIVILICILVYKLMEHLTPRTLKIMCGNR